MRIVLDTNVLLSAMMVRDSPPDRIYRAWIGRQFDLVCCEQLLGEIRDFSRRPALRARIRPAEAGTLINAIRKLSIMIDRLPAVDRSPDPNDNFLLALVQVSNADYLVTGDKSGLLQLEQFGNTRIVTARHLVEQLNLFER